MIENRVILLASVIIPHGKKFILVRDSDGQYGLPGGRIKSFDNILKTTKMQVEEETDIRVSLENQVIGAYNYESEAGEMLKFVFSSMPVKLKHPIQRNLQEFSLDELESGYREGALRSGKATLLPVKDYVSGQRFSLNFLHFYRSLQEE